MAAPYRPLTAVEAGHVASITAVARELADALARPVAPAERPFAPAEVEQPPEDLASLIEGGWSSAW